MKNVSHTKNWNAGTVQVHVEPPSITLIKSNNNEKSDKYFVKNKLRRDKTSEKLYPMNSKWPCLIMANLRSFCYFTEITNEMTA